MATQNLCIFQSAPAELRDRSLLIHDTKFRSGQKTSVTNRGGFISGVAFVAPSKSRVNGRKGFKLFCSAQNTRVEEHSDFRNQHPSVTTFNLNNINGPDLQCKGKCFDKESQISNWLSHCRELPSGFRSTSGGMGKTIRNLKCPCASMDDQETESGTDATTEQNDESLSMGVSLAIAALKFYKREISPLLPGSCRYVPTCSEYGMQAFKKYGVVKGTILTAWRLSRCNPLGGSGFDPPRWFDEARPPPY